MSNDSIWTRVRTYFSRTDKGGRDITANKTRANDGRIIKQDVDRRMETHADVLNAAQKHGARMWEIDPVTLCDYADNPVAHAFIDTMSKDVGSLEWEVTPRNGEDDAAEDRVQKVEERLDELPAEDWTFNDLIEATSRSMLRTGNGAWGYHYYSTEGKLAEIVMPSVRTMYKTTDEDGNVSGYVQVTKTSRNATALEKDEVAWFEWSSSPDRYYGVGPVEMSRDSIVLLDEILMKEQKDLQQGTPSGFFRVGTNVSEEKFKEFRESWKMKEGQRHRGGPIRADDAEWISIDENYGDLQLIERWKRSVTEVGANMKVNPSYAGFDFENTNRATDESQRESYEKRGLRVLMRQLEETINSQLIRPHFGDDLRFTFVEERDREAHVDYLDKAAEAMAKLQDAGVATRWEAGQPVVVEERDTTVAGDDDGEADGDDDGAFKQVGGANPDSLTARQQDVEAAYNEPFRQVIDSLEQRHDSRRDAIAELKGKLDSLSPNTYYNWLRQTGHMDDQDD